MSRLTGLFHTLLWRFMPLQSSLRSKNQKFGRLRQDAHETLYNTVGLSAMCCLSSICSIPSSSTLVLENPHNDMTNWATILCLRTMICRYASGVLWCSFAGCALVRPSVEDEPLGDVGSWQVQSELLRCALGGAASVHHTCDGGITK